MNKLTDTVALITRPLAQGKKLRQKIEKEGGKTVLFPCIEIISYRGSPEIKNALGKIADYSWAIFSSANAVAAVAELWPRNSASPSIIAMGSGTAQELKKQNILVSQIPAVFSSEGILQLPELQNIKNQKIAIFCGEHPKPSLKAGLLERGASVTEIYCYRRARPTLRAENNIPEATRKTINVIITASRESLLNLHDLFTPADRAWLLDKPLLVISQEMLKCASNLGWKRIYLAKNPSDEAIVEALGDVQ